MDRHSFTQVTFVVTLFGHAQSITGSHKHECVSQMALQRCNVNPRFCFQDARAPENSCDFFNGFAWGYCIEKCWELFSEVSAVAPPRIPKIISQMALKRRSVKFSARFLGWNLEGEFWELNSLRVNFREGLFCWKNRMKKLDLRIRGQYSGVQNSSAQDSVASSGSGGAKSPGQKFVPENMYIGVSLPFVFVAVCIPAGQSKS